MAAPTPGPGPPPPFKPRPARPLGRRCRKGRGRASRGVRWCRSWPVSRERGGVGPLCNGTGNRPAFGLGARSREKARATKPSRNAGHVLFPAAPRSRGGRPRCGPTVPRPGAPVPGPRGSRLPGSTGRPRGAPAAERGWRRKMAAARRGVVGWLGLSVRLRLRHLNGRRGWRCLGNSGGDSAGLGESSSA